MKLLTAPAAFISLFLQVLPHAIAQPSTPPDQLLLKDFKPRSIFNIPQTRVERARFPVIDVHSHVYVNDQTGVDRWVKIMDDVGLERSIILAGSTGSKFDDHVALFSKHPTRFELWCGFDLSGIDQPDFTKRAVAELERCFRAGAKGVGELSDKGAGLRGANGVHCDDPRLDPLFAKCAELGLPINIHIGEDQWMYEPMDQHNDGLMNSYKWRIPKDPNVLGHPEVLATLPRMLKKHPNLTVIACHLANCCADLNQLAAMFDEFPNLYADIGARFAEIGPIPRFMQKFFSKYQDRILYGTDTGNDPEMYRTSFRLLETADEHIYPVHFGKYHWPLQGFDLPDDILRKLYRDNALKIFGWISQK
jgi:predicted TIM-barrel fold metal-dependent hydrolase